MASVWGELKRRNVVKVAVAYAIVGWVLIEVSATVLPIFEAPDWIVQVFTFFVILGFPLALILSWAYEITPGGIKLERDVAAEESITHVTGRKLDFAIIGALVLALGFVVYNYVLEEGEVAVGVLPNSVAVIPFENMSVDPEEAFYASGIHEEILNQLVKLSALNVIARTSMQQYANTEKSIPEIARELNVETVMEGSVRYANGQIRITVQLNDGVTGAHLWSETYTRDFDDIFAIESDIAMNVANAVGAKFSLAEQESIEKIPTDSLAAYALYLRALSTSQGPVSTLKDLDRAISLDPEFALARGFKALEISFQIRIGNLDSDEWQPIARAAAERAIALDPTVGSAHAALAALYATNWRWGEAQQAYERVYRLNPKDVAVLQAYGVFMRDTGQYAESVRLYERVRVLDPSAGAYQLGLSYRYAGNYAAAAETFRNLSELDLARSLRHMQLGFTEIIAGNREEGLTELQTAEQLWGDSIPTDRIAQVAIAYAALELSEDVERLVTEFEDRASAEPVGNAQWAMIYLAQGDYEQAFERLEAMIDDPIGEARWAQIKANEFGDPELDKPHWRELRDRLGALE